jgi:hypothetical protein
MAVVATIAAVAGAGASIASAVNQQKAAKSAQKQQELSYNRSQKQAIREAQIRRAQATSSAQSMGAMTSSGFAGGVSSLTSQLGSTLGYSSQLSGLSKEQAMYQSRAATFGAASDLAFAGSSLAARYIK